MIQWLHEMSYVFKGYVVGAPTELSDVIIM